MNMGKLAQGCGLLNWKVEEGGTNNLVSSIAWEGFLKLLSY